MITYEVKISIDPNAESDWLNWMKTKHVPDVIATGLVRSFQILSPQGEDNTYHFHYHFENQADYDRYQQEFSTPLRDDHNQRYADKIQSASRQVYNWI